MVCISICCKLSSILLPLKKHGNTIYRKAEIQSTEVQKYKRQKGRNTNYGIAEIKVYQKFTHYSKVTHSSKNTHNSFIKLDQGKLWPNQNVLIWELKTFGSIWTHLGPFWAMWTNLELFEAIWNFSYYSCFFPNISYFSYLSFFSFLWKIILVETKCMNERDYYLFVIL